MGTISERELQRTTSVIDREMHLSPRRGRRRRSGRRSSGQREPALRPRGGFEDGAGVQRPGVGLGRSSVLRENSSSWFVHHIFYAPIATARNSFGEASLIHAYRAWATRAPADVWNGCNLRAWLKADVLLLRFRRLPFHRPTSEFDIWLEHSKPAYTNYLKASILERKRTELDCSMEGRKGGTGYVTIRV